MRSPDDAISRMKTERGYRYRSRNWIQWFGIPTALMTNMRRARESQGNSGDHRKADDGRTTSMGQKPPRAVSSGRALRARRGRTDRHVIHPN